MRWSARLAFVALAAGLVLAVGARSSGSLAFAEADAASPAGEVRSDAESSAEGGDAGAEAGSAGRYADPREQSAEGGAYYYRQMILALVVMVAMIALLAWIVRRQKRLR